jgi:hypothetical protein
MKREVSIVLSREVKNHRKLAQEWFGLTDEQMKDCDVHHNPPRHQGGRNIPEHLFVYHYTLHSAIHKHDFVLWARKGARLGGQHTNPNGGIVSCKKMRESQTGLFDPKLKPFRSEWTSRAGEARAQQMASEGYPGLGASSEAASEAGKKAAAQRWRCLITEHISSAASLARFQKARGIDTSLRERLK